MEQRVRIGNGRLGKSPLENSCGGFIYTKDYLEKKAFMSGCGLYVSWEKCINDIDYLEETFCFENDNVVFRCPWHKKNCEQNHPLLRDDVYAVRENINRVLDLSNHEFLTLESGRQIIVEKNVYASEVSQIVSETSIQDAIKVLEYNHFANKGDVQRKKEILIALANYLEPFRRELNNSEELKDILKVNNQKVIAFEKLFEMYNNFGLRHNNSNQYHLDLADDELEQWYDDIYTSTLFVILSMDESRILSKLKTLREG